MVVGKNLGSKKDAELQGLVLFVLLLWKGGGTVFGPEPHSYSHKLSKKLSRLARKSVLSSKVSDGDLLIVDNFKLENHKTSGFCSILKNLKLADKKITILSADNGNRNLDMSTRNLRNVHLVNSKKCEYI